MTNQPQTPSIFASNSPAKNNPAKNTPPSGSTTLSGDPGNGRGSTTIADAVVAKIAGIATRDIPGVYALGGGAARALGSLRDAIGQSDVAQGISVEVGQTQAAVDVTLIVEYPHPLQNVARSVRDAIYTAVEDLVGLQVTEVNINITDVHIPTDDDKSSYDARQDTQRGTRVS
ncbi:Asp23/Gls24 family envelope stress response protein [Arthrobacter sp. H14-L1]|uniref:Asp23/Gls24 family envelope stress response protein n=1 Tax=Arthrobacter sp. H14-L1 TaxID=2996697 RepID=UPI00226DED10|nr:Asp23/Gls24 family envelope stress response protein [Arthrobacter sp. H14-L1]MCY0903921.1 Asp23/Gls24 family envelope stress response protein [Arthrobacter sp. H14-L1]